jgi:elongation factor G
VRAASRSDEDKIGNALAKLHEEDPTFQFGYEPELKQTIIRGMGELHLEVQMER